MRKVGFLVVLGADEPESVNDVDDLDSCLFEGFLLLLSGRVGANV
jgi:hypothetical protein